MDINVLTLKGTTILNSKVGLSVYQNSRSALGFSGLLFDCNAALLVLGYSVETTVLVGTATSSVRYYNTQYGGNIEAIAVSVSDQGNTGSTGVASTTSTLLPVTIVAVNNAPVIAMAVTEYAVTENTLQSLAGIGVSDVDIDEQIVSTLASLDWLNKAEYQLLINAATIDLSVAKGRLFLGYSSNLHLLQTKELTALTMKGWMYADKTADFCRLKDFTYASAQTGLDGLQPYGIGTDSLVLQLPSGLQAKFHDVCYYANVGTTNCPSGEGAGCVCNVNINCDTSSEYGILFNRSRKGYDVFQAALTQVVATLDRTCGGVPYQRWPNDFSFGKPCLSRSCASGTPCDECGPDVLPKCSPYSQDPLSSLQRISNGTCRCCGDLSRACSTDADCAGLPANGCPSFQMTSLCGCQAGGPPGITPPGKCGPYTFEPTPPLSKDDPNYGRLHAACRIVTFTPCTFAGQASSLCRAAMYAYNGTNQQLITSQLGIGMQGSKEISMFGSIVDINRLLTKLNYLPDLYYSRRYRLPPELRDQNFKIESDDLETLVVSVSDNGNSGGGLRDPQPAVSTVVLRVAALNDPPEIDAPTEIRAEEDVLFRFEPSNRNKSTCPDARVRQAYAGTLQYNCLPVQIADPDYLEYEFDNILFLLEISAQHGRIFFNETFLAEVRYRSSPTIDRQAGCRDCKRQVDLETCCSCTPSLPGCSLDFLSSGMEATGLYASPEPVYGVGNKRIALVGSFIDLNLALAGLAYLGESNFNTRYGLTEYVNITVTDYALIPSEPSWTKVGVNFIISVIIESSNDPPVIGRLLTVTTYSVGIAHTSSSLVPISTDQNVADHCLTLVATSEEYWTHCKAFPSSCPTADCIFGTQYRQYIDIDEDTIFIFDNTCVKLCVKIQYPAEPHFQHEYSTL